MKILTTFFEGYSLGRESRPMKLFVETYMRNAYY